MQPSPPESFHNGTFDNQLYMMPQQHSMQPRHMQSIGSQHQEERYSQHLQTLSDTLTSGNVSDSSNAESPTIPGVREVSGDMFLEDPVMLRRTCIPVERTKDKADRLSYECLQQVRGNLEATLHPTINHWLTVFDKIETMTWGGNAEKRNAVMAHYMKKNGYESRQHAYNRAVNRTVREVTMTNVPEVLRSLPDGSTFLQVQEPGLHIYMSQTIIRRAVSHDLFALVGEHPQD
ncbi:unnamed protein product [Cylicocyclus nassatus]|uniref:Uncharacterized protein n=1 Tax=Cylicocyclus nassatus TaxID=53992 RepID=A0AA36HEX9_CYLNA|nr:unnamed protein product [Cylicocyclus nassatus]